MGEWVQPGEERVIPFPACGGRLACRGGEGTAVVVHVAFACDGCGRAGEGGVPFPVH